MACVRRAGEVDGFGSRFIGRLLLVELVHLQNEGADVSHREGSDDLIRLRVLPARCERVTDPSAFAGGKRELDDQGANQGRGGLGGSPADLDGAGADCAATKEPESLHHGH